MIQVLLDTSFLISFADPERPNHRTAKHYFECCLEKSFPIYLSTIAAGEFAVRQPVTELPLSNFLVLPYNMPHAICAAKFVAALMDLPKSEQDSRPIILNDLKLLAQAESEKIGILISEDKNTLYRKAEQLRERGLANVDVLLLSEGFAPGRLNDPRQQEFQI
jgi:predicted nucleic acid-binding protein